MAINPRCSSHLRKMGEEVACINTILKNGEKHRFIPSSRMLAISDSLEEVQKKSLVVQESVGDVFQRDYLDQLMDKSVGLYSRLEVLEEQMLERDKHLLADIGTIANQVLETDLEFTHLSGSEVEQRIDHYFKQLDMLCQENAFDRDAISKALYSVYVDLNNLHFRCDYPIVDSLRSNPSHMNFANVMHKMQKAYLMESEDADILFSHLSDSQRELVYLQMAKLFNCDSAKDGKRYFEDADVSNLLRAEAVEKTMLSLLAISDLARSFLFIDVEFAMGEYDKLSDSQKLAIDKNLWQICASTYKSIKPCLLESAEARHDVALAIMVMLGEMIKA
jgi:hypothetical protein